MYDFNSLSNRLLHADYIDFNDVLDKFIKFINKTDIIHDYIVDCGECDQDMQNEFKEVRTQRAIFSLGDTVEEEVRNIFAILSHIVKNNIYVFYSIGSAYSNARNYQDILSDFNDRVTKVLIGHIEGYLTKVGIDMGFDYKIVYNITIRDGQVNIANENASINASNVVNSVDMQELARLINDVREKAEDDDISDEEKETIANSLEVFEEEIKSKKPRKGFIQSALTGFKIVKGTTDLVTTINKLIQFLQPILKSIIL